MVRAACVATSGLRRVLGVQSGLMGIDLWQALPGTARLAGFLLASLAMLLTPGPAVMYIIARGIGQGWRAGVASAAAVGGGNFIHALAATAGLSALLVASSEAFTVVKWAGAAYLAYIGIRTLRTREPEIADVTPPIQPIRAVMRQGFVVAVLNPKTAIFFLAFVPQFVDPTRGNVSAQFFVLGTLFAAMGVVTDGTYGVLAGALRGLLAQRREAQRRARYATGGLYIALGVSAALADAPST
jgi:threonine/homoserine/homoserine lactone efflux protein